MNKYILITLVFTLMACGNTNETANDNLPINKVTYTGHGNNQGEGQQHRHRHRNRGMNTESGITQGMFVSNDTVFVPAGSPVRSRLILQTVMCSEFPGKCMANGIVRPLPGHLAEIASPFEGRVTRSLVRLGQKVISGTPLFEVSSSDYLEAVRTYLEASRQKELAEKNYNRKKDLLDSGVGSRKEFEEAKLEFDLAEKELEKTVAIMKIFNINPDDADLTRPLIIRSPVAGEVVRTDITPGQYIKADSDPIVTVAGLDKVQVVAHVREKEIGSVGVNDHVEVRTESLPHNPVVGKVEYVGNMMNEQSRTVEVYIECDNSKRMLKPGMFVSVIFTRNIPNAIVIPASSVLQENDRSVVYVQAGENTFVKRQVSVSSASGNELIVSSGLENGNTIVSEGGIYLR